MLTTTILLLFFQQTGFADSTATETLQERKEEFAKPSLLKKNTERKMQNDAARALDLGIYKVLAGMADAVNIVKQQQHSPKELEKLSDHLKTVGNGSKEIEQAKLVYENINNEQTQTNLPKIKPEFPAEFIGPKGKKIIENFNSVTSLNADSLIQAILKGDDVFEQLSKNRYLTLSAKELKTRAEMPKEMDSNAPLGSGFTVADLETEIAGFLKEPDEVKMPDSKPTAAVASATAVPVVPLPEPVPEPIGLLDRIKRIYHSLFP